MQQQLESQSKAELLEKGKRIQFNFKRTGYIIGICMLILLVFTDYFVKQRNNDIFGFTFLIGYGATLIYFIATLITYRIVKIRYEFKAFLSQELVALSVFSFSISAYILNYSITVFSTFVWWAFASIIVVHLCILGISVYSRLPRFLKPILAFLSSLSLVFSLLQFVHTSAISHIGILASPFFAISLHVFIPLIIATFFSVFFFKKLLGDKILKSCFLVGLVVSIGIITTFLVQWKSVDAILHKAQVVSITGQNQELPKWVLFSQNWPDTHFGRLILEGNLIYDKPLTSSNFGMRNNSFDEDKKHDPLVLLATTLFGDIRMDEQDRIKVIQSQFDARHKAHRKLWSGKNLETSDIISNIQVFPEYRLAYQEKILTIQNNQDRDWRTQQEAVYTFHIPEGSLVSSLSLWVNGIEEKSRLTTKGKADSAYVNIVGVQRRDPALLHWQEGNRITVTVFPCTPQEARVFKVGFTTPLEERGEQLVLKNIYFEGPSVEKAIETCLIEIKGASANIPRGFKQTSSSKFERSGDYEPYWEIAFDKPPLSSNSFVFQGKGYHLEKPKIQKENIDLKEIYLDLNSAWTDEEITRVLQMFADRKVFVYQQEMIEVSKNLPDFIKDKSQKQRFSLFPFHRIADPENALIITKIGGPTPNLSDLDKSIFLENLEKFISKKKKPNLFLIGNEWSAYLGSLKQFDVFTSMNGSLDRLAEILDQGQFIRPNSDENNVYVAQSNVIISRDTGHAEANAEAPDHLLRLFNYNRILQDIGSNYFIADQYAEGELLTLANEAFVVSPISSLVVLETQKDYERFDIDENKNSLNNASTQSSGAVPEPHEWALIILTALILLFVTYKKRLRWNSR